LSTCGSVVTSRAQASAARATGTCTAEPSMSTNTFSNAICPLCCASCAKTAPEERRRGRRGGGENRMSHLWSP
jgi:hypothetical protein